MGNKDKASAHAPKGTQKEDYIHEAISVYANKLEHVIKDSLRNDDFYVAHFYDVQEDRIIFADYSIVSNVDFIVGDWSDTMTVEDYQRQFGAESVPSSKQLKDLRMQLISEDTFHPKTHLSMVSPTAKVPNTTETISVLDAISRIKLDKLVYARDTKTQEVTQITRDKALPMNVLFDSELYAVDPSIHDVKVMLHYMVAHLGSFCAYLSEDDALEKLSLPPSKRGKGYFVGLGYNLRLVFFDAHETQFNNITHTLETKYDLGDGSHYALNQLELVSYCTPIAPIQYTGK